MLSHTPGRAGVPGPAAADWLIRRALPSFLARAGFTADAVWFARLPPYPGHGPAGTVRPWRGAAARVARLRHATRTRLPDGPRHAPGAAGSHLPAPAQAAARVAYSELLRTPFVCDAIRLIDECAALTGPWPQDSAVRARATDGAGGRAHAACRG